MPEFVEAELAGEDAAASFPDVQAHLDTCERCSQLYAELVDVLLADAAGEISAVFNLPPVKRPAAVLVRKRVRAVTAGVIAGLGLYPRDLEPALRYVFSDQVPANFLPRGHAVAERPGSLLAEQSSGGAPGLLRRVVIAEAERAHLSSAAAESFVNVAYNQFERNFSELVDLAGRPDMNA